MAGSKYVAIRRLGGTAEAMGRDLVMEEQPVAISVVDEYGNDHPLVQTLATPVELGEMALGFLYSETIISSYADLLKLEVVDRNSLRAHLRSASIEQISARQRLFLQHSGCGLCSARLIDASMSRTKRQRPAPSIDLATALALSAEARAQQVLFARTGGGHAAALFNADGQLLHLSEDVGRHNAVDKVIGWALQQGQDLSALWLWVSGRAGFELVQKAVRAELGAMLAMGAPSSLACELARASDLTLVAFIKKNNANIYNPGH